MGAWPKGRYMRVLIADDDAIGLRLLDRTIRRLHGYEVVAVTDGLAALRVLEASDPPPLAILDWMMPNLDGVDVCRNIRNTPRLQSIYIILVTGKESRESRLEGLRAGANDYITKPFDPAELEARVRVATRVVELQLQLHRRVFELEQTLARVKRLERSLPICMYCKKIRDEQNSWHQIESYIEAHSDAEFSHGICTECFEKLDQHFAVM
jgi:DNA-binding response OmpR family regulator